MGKKTWKFGEKSRIISPIALESWRVLEYNIGILYRNGSDDFQIAVCGGARERRGKTS
jgi:hypothetical protein